MILLVVNYQNEIDIDYFAQYDFVHIKIINEQKGSIFALKLLKYIVENKGKYELVLHFGLCGGQDESLIGNIYKIDRTFLYHKDDIIENQRFRLGSLNFDTIFNSNIVTKFCIGKHLAKLYDFAPIYDLETFWVSQISTQFSLAIICVKGVSDINEFFKYNEDQQIEYLLDPQNTGNRNKKILELLKTNIDLVNSNFKEFFSHEFIFFYQKIKTDKCFKKQLLH